MEKADYKNLSKNNVISYVSKLNELRPEVVSQVLARFPELAGLIKSSLSEYKDILEKIVASDDESVNQIYGNPFILENNFEYSSEQGIKNLLEKYQYSALTITLTGDYKVIYRRFLKRESSPDRHRGHVVNDCYPEKKEDNLKTPKVKTISYEYFVRGIEQRGFDAFLIDGRQIKVDTTDFSKINMEELFSQIAAWREELNQHDSRKRQLDHARPGMGQSLQNPHMAGTRKLDKRNRFPSAVRM